MAEHFYELELAHAEKWGKGGPAFYSHLNFYVPGDEKQESVCFVKAQYKKEYERVPSYNYKGDIVSWSTIPKSSRNTHMLIVFKHGFSGIKKVMDYDPSFFPSLLTQCYGGAFPGKVVRLDLCTDTDGEVLSDAINSIKLNHYNSFGRGITLLRKLTKQQQKENRAAKKDGLEEIHKSKYTISQRETFDEELELNEKQIETIYVGNFKKSTTSIVLYDKSSQEAKKKKRYAPFKNRIEVRAYPKDEEALEKNYTENSGKKQKQKISNVSTNLSLNVISSIFRDYRSEKSIGIRNLIWLHSVLNGFTLSKTAKRKEELTPLFVDQYLMPILAITKKMLLENKYWLFENYIMDKYPHLMSEAGQQLAFVFSQEDVIRELKDEIRARNLEGELKESKVEVREHINVEREPKVVIRERKLDKKETSSNTTLFMRKGVLIKDLSVKQLENIYKDLNTYVNSEEIKKKTEKDFIENFLSGKKLFFFLF